MRKPWMEAGDDRYYSADIVFLHIAQMAGVDEGAALLVVEMTFLDTLDWGDSSEMEFLSNLLSSDPEGLRQLFSHPTLTGAAEETPAKPMALLYLELQDPVAAEVIKAFDWVQDGLHMFEINCVIWLSALALESPMVFQALLEVERDWIPPQVQSDFVAIERLVRMSAVNEGLAMRIVMMPLLTTIDFGDIAALDRLTNLASSDPALVHEMLAHPALNDTNADGDGATIARLYLKWRDPEASAALESLSWVKDGLGRPAYEGFGLLHPDPADFEEGLTLDLLNLALRSREMFMAMVGKSWMQDPVTAWEFDVVSGLLEFAGLDLEAALRIVEMPFLDTIERDDAWTLEQLTDLRRLDADALRTLLSDPKFAGGITDGQLVAVSVLSFEYQNPDAAAALGALPWVLDGIDSSEEEAVLALRGLALGSQQVFGAVIGKSWAMDGLSADEASTVQSLIGLSHKNLSRRDESAALRILDMPFLEAVDGVDAAAIRSLHILSFENTPSYLGPVLDHPTLRGGVTDDLAIVVAALKTVVRERPDLLETLLDPDAVTVEKRVAHLPHSGAVTLSALFIGSGNHRTLDLLEHAVRTQEEFMALPFPTSYVGLVVADATSHRGGGGPGGIITIDPGSEENLHLIAHEAAHTYWPFSPGWISEGGAQFMEAVTKNAQTGAALEPYHASCALASNLRELDQLAFDPALDRNVIYNSACMYNMGQGLFTDLHLSLGGDAFRKGFGTLYLKLRDEADDDVCAGIERGICYVRAAFVGSATPQDAAIAEPIIDRWYNGAPLD